MEGEYPPIEYHARMRWEQERAGEYIHTPFTESAPTEYHARMKQNDKFRRAKEERIRRGWY